MTAALTTDMYDIYRRVRHSAELRSVVDVRPRRHSQFPLYMSAREDTPECCDSSVCGCCRATPEPCHSTRERPRRHSQFPLYMSAREDTPECCDTCASQQKRAVVTSTVDELLWVHCSGAKDYSSTSIA